MLKPDAVKAIAFCASGFILFGFMYDVASRNGWDTTFIILFYLCVVGPVLMELFYPGSFLKRK